jgi:periplasmic divalent cation tolerance protein
MTDSIIALTTTNTKKEAKKLAKKIVEGRLAACVNIIPKIRSFYEWEGAIRDEEEHLLIMKTTREKFEALRDFIEKKHSYECPEFITIDIDSGLPAYLQWISDVTS